MESARYAAEHVVAAAAANGPAQRELLLAGYPDRVRQEWGAHFTQGRVLAQLIGSPAVMKAAVRTGMAVPALMRFVVRVMTELSDRPAATWEDRVVSLLDALTPATGNTRPPKTR
jgi:flavin-dependent dehydrogenase